MYRRTGEAAARGRVDGLKRIYTHFFFCRYYYNSRFIIDWEETRPGKHFRLVFVFLDSTEHKGRDSFRLGPVFCNCIVIVVAYTAFANV